MLTTEEVLSVRKDEIEEETARVKAHADAEEAEK
jgi:hypothetical protein